MPDVLESIKKYAVNEVTTEQILAHIDIEEDVNKPYAESFYKSTLRLRFKYYLDMSEQERADYKQYILVRFKDDFPQSLLENGDAAFYDALCSWITMSDLYDYLLFAEHCIAEKYMAYNYEYPNQVRRANENCIVNLHKHLNKKLDDLKKEFSPPAAKPAFSIQYFSNLLTTIPSRCLNIMYMQCLKPSFFNS